MTPTTSLTRNICGLILVVLFLISSIESHDARSNYKDNPNSNRRKNKLNNNNNNNNNNKNNNNNNNNINNFNNNSNIKLCSPQFESKLACHCMRDNKEIHFVDCLVVHKELSQEDPAWLPFDQHAHIQHFKLTILQNGYMSYLPFEVFKKLFHLQTITITHADVREIPMFAFSNLSKLENISLTSNHIRILDEKSFANHPSLKMLNLENNDICDIDRNAFDNIDNLTELILTKNNITIIHDRLFKQFGKLVTLKLNENYITKLTNFTFEGLFNLRTLILSYNNIDVISDAVFSDLWKLEELDLSSNLIHKLSERAFDGLNILQSLNLEDNRITILENSVFSVVPALKTLKLNNNLLETLTEANLMSLMDNLINNRTELTISDNYFICDCRLKWVYVLHEQTKSIHLKHILEELKCTMDDNYYGEILNSRRHSYDNENDIYQQTKHENLENDVHVIESNLNKNYNNVNLLTIKLNDLPPCADAATESSEVPLSRESIGLERNWFSNGTQSIYKFNIILMFIIGWLLLVLLT